MYYLYYTSRGNVLLFEEHCTVYKVYLLEVLFNIYSFAEFEETLFDKKIDVPKVKFFILTKLLEKKSFFSS